jgi:hypothetical protein
MKRVLLGAAAALALAAPAYADGTRISIAPFQSRQAWQANWDKLNQRGNDAGAQWECHGDHECNLYFIVKPGVKAHLATERYGRGYCYIVESAPTADCYREDGKKSVWTLDKPFDYGLAPQSSSPTEVASAPPPVQRDFQGNPLVAPAPASSYSSSFTVPLIPDGSGENVSVKLGSTYYTMILDTGATTGLVPPEVAIALISRGEATEVGGGTITIADGSERAERRINVYSVQLGDHTIHNVMFGVGQSGNNTMLFGLLPLSRFGKFTVDAQNSALMFN